jgi:hypothetical protein
MALPLRYPNYPHRNPQLVGDWLNHCTERFIDRSLRNMRLPQTGVFDDWHVSIRHVPFGSSSRQLVFFYRPLFGSAIHSPFLETQHGESLTMGDLNAEQTLWLLFLVLYTAVTLLDRTGANLPFQLFTNNTILKLKFYQHMLDFKRKVPTFYMNLASREANDQADAAWARCGGSPQRWSLGANTPTPAFPVSSNGDRVPRQPASGPGYSARHQFTPPSSNERRGIPQPPATNPGYRTRQEPTVPADDKGDKVAEQPAADAAAGAAEPPTEPPENEESQLPGGDLEPGPSWLADLDSDYVPPELPTHVDPQYLVLRREEDPWLPPSGTRPGSPDLPKLLFEEPMLWPSLHWFGDLSLSVAVQIFYPPDENEMDDNGWFGQFVNDS